MGRIAARIDVLDQAWSATNASAEASGIKPEELTSVEDLQEASALFDAVWSGAAEQLVPISLLRALAHSGNYAAGARSNGELVGAIVGFLGRDDEGPYLHSHILGVTSSARGRNIGYSLKQHQRAWSLERSIRKVTWTFDPLVSRNAYFNLTKLGAEAAEYLTNFYGQMTDSINNGGESDRLLVEWKLDSPRAIHASNGKVREARSIDGYENTAIELDEVEGRPVIREPTGAPTILIKTPEDIVRIRADSPEGAKQWRAAQRSTLSRAMADGYRVESVTRKGWYVLSS